MKNNKGIGKFEVLTMMVIGMVVVVLVLWYFIGVAGRERFTTMKKNVFTFKQAVIGNMDEFNTYNVAYLGEAVTGGFISAIKSPFSANNCSLSESKVVVENNKARVTLRCDNYLVDNSDASLDYEDVVIYKISNWSLKKPKGEFEEKVLYNCLDGGKEKYDEYVEELYLVALVNNDYGSEHHSASTIQNECKVVSKTFYRTKEELK